jgi:hypothetical protein
VNGKRCSGFDPERIQSCLDINITSAQSDLETCPKQSVPAACKP